ncbi:recombinase family protein [Methylomonas sp. 11b]|uniref:recombinase family protein n=1 Tax=Methylomonas sp. 11b TaxID=1168169 RepID=UPI003FA5CABB
MAVALYARVSTTRQAENDLSIPDQLKQMRDWCNANGYSVAQEYIESGASATDDKRPIFQQMIREATLSPSPFEAVIVHSQSRFFRNSIDFGLYERKLNQADVRLFSITQPTSEDASGDMVRKIFSVFDEFQSKETGKHTARSMLENARQGFFNGAQPPFGYRTIETETIGNRGRKKKRLIIDEAEAETVRRIFRLYIHGQQGKPLGMKSIATHLNQQGVTMRGRPWRTQKLHDLLSDTLYMGEYYYNQYDSKRRKLKPKEDWIKVSVDPIIDESTFAKARGERAERAPGAVAPRLVSSPILLSGLLTCAECGSGMSLMTGKSGKYRYYKCTNQRDKGKNRCSTPNIPMDKLDQLVLEGLANRICKPERIKSMLSELQKQRKQANAENDQQLTVLKNQIKGNEQKTANLYQAIENGLPFDDSTKERLHKLKAERENLLIEISAIRRHQSIPTTSINQNQIDAFCRALKTRLLDRSSGFGKGYLKLLVDEVRIDGKQAIMQGSYENLAYAVGSSKEASEEVPTFMRQWRPGDDSNVRPVP